MLSWMMELLRALMFFQGGKSARSCLRGWRFTFGLFRSLLHAQLDDEIDMGLERFFLRRSGSEFLLGRIVFHFGFARLLLQYMLIWMVVSILGLRFRWRNRIQVLLRRIETHFSAYLGH